MTRTPRARPRPLLVNPFPLGFGGELLHISHDSVTKDGETADERNAHLAKNVDRQRCQDEETTHGVNGDLNAPHRVRCNLDDFDMVDNKPVQHTPSANLIVVFNELAKLP